MSLEQSSISSPSTGGPRRRRKGQTCLNCRRRKIRCDGVRPVCGLCASGNSNFEDCEYPGDTPTATQLLEHRIHQVQNQIRGLEDPDDGPSLALHHPYAGPLATQSPSSSGSSLSSDGHSPHSSPTLRSPRNETEKFQEPPVNRRRDLLGPFMNVANQFGFFLNIGRFYQITMLPHPFGDVARPSPALLSVIYLWARHFSSSGPPEKMLLSGTLYHLAQDLAGSHPNRIMHSIQAEVLLSYYFMKSGKILEGTHHADAALSLAIAANLHRIRSQNTLQASTRELPPPADPIEEGERIDAFWTVLILNNHWAAIQESQSIYFPFQSDAVDTPWPMDSIQHEYFMLPVASHATLQGFLDGRSVDGLSEKALYAKSSILLERAGSIHHGGHRGILQSGAFARLDSLIDTVQSNLPLIDAATGSEQARSRRAVTQMMLYGALIKLHRPFVHEIETSYHKSIYAARSIARLTRYSICSTSNSHIDPIVGVIWNLACETLSPLVVTGAGNDLAASLNLMISYLNQFSEKNPLFSKYISK